MRGLVIADLEGIIGVYDLNDEPTCKKLLAKEIEVLINTMKSLKVDDITICDIHNKGELLDKEIVYIHKANYVSKLWNICFNKKYDFAILTGFHGMRSSGGLFAHTIRPDIKNVYVGNSPVGEVEIFSRWLGCKGIPVILVSGDIEAAREANMFNKNRQACVVKNKHKATVQQDSIYYDILRNSTIKALLSDFEPCLSFDHDPINIEFFNNDVTNYLEKSYNINGSILSFSNCNEFVVKLEFLSKQLMSIFNSILMTNKRFAKDMQKYINNIDINSIADADIKELFNSSIFSLDNCSREKIKNYVKLLIESESRYENN